MIFRKKLDELSLTTPTEVNTMSQILEILGCKYPIIQGPIGALNNPKMVAAVSEAGAFGLIALGYATDMDAVKTTVAQVKDLTDKPFGANLMIAINPKLSELLAAGAGQVSALIKEIKPIKDIIAEMVA